MGSNPTYNFGTAMTSPKNDAVHVEHPTENVAPQDGQPASAPIEMVERGLPSVDKDTNIDPETAQYLDVSVEIDEETNQRIRKLLNRRILPLLCLAYFCQLFDKGTLAFSSIIGLQEDTHLKGNEYALLGTILYVGYVVGEFAINRIIQKVPVAKLLGTLVCIWGAIVAFHAACHNFGGLLAVRLLLGLFESGVQPCLMTLTIMYYRRSEHPTIISYWYCQQGVQLMVNGLLAYAFTFLKNGPIRPWQALFIFVGCFTVCVGILVLIFLPDSPMRAKCWDRETKTLIIERLRVNELGVQERHFKRDQMIEAFLDPIVWFYVALQISCFTIVSGLTVFNNIIVTGLGFSVRQTQLLNLAQGAWFVIIYVGSAWLARKTQQTCLVLGGFMVVALAGTIVLDTVKVTSGTAAGLLIAFYLANCVVASGNLLFSLVSRNIAGQTKKVTCLTILFIAYALGNILGPQVFQATDKPRYHNAFAAHIALYAFFLVLLFITRLVLMRRNHTRRQSLNPSAGTTGVETVEHDNAFSDLTDRQNTRAFRYMY